MMFKVDKLTLITGSKIFVPQYELFVHQPTLLEIGDIGEIKFFQGINTLFPPKEPLEEAVSQLEGVSTEQKEEMINSLDDFDHFLFLLRVTEMGKKEGERTINLFKLFANVLELMFPKHTLSYDYETDFLLLNPENQMGKMIVIDEILFTIIQDIVKQIFKTGELFAAQDTGEMSEAAKRIAAKIEEGERKIREQKGEVDDDGEIISRIVSILGMQIDLFTIVNMTVYQLLNQFERFNLYSSHQQAVRAATVGAEVEIENWYKKI